MVVGNNLKSASVNLQEQRQSQPAALSAAMQERCAVEAKLLVQQACASGTRHQHILGHDKIFILRDACRHVASAQLTAADTVVAYMVHPKIR